MIEYDKLQKALKHLQVQFENHCTLDENMPELIKEAVAESVIQRFETCWDCLWKVLKRYLSEEIGLPEVPNGPNPVLRLANENNLLPTPIEAWLKYAGARVSTSHDYSGEKAKEALALMSDFINDAVALYQTLSGERWA
ncbi:nucleotidyltransferase substrate binding protein [Marinobacterium arenosum]|uniref:nucleotidyltransferase substrate binding protein n=1 Tax=Marinobacterium arenosum TaxID=2862496 RepID=UPI001C96F964|nr:nucleotidyltransferase substrate binding protein [Marinobacterium arenosum]MBY4677848.1 nucleotidyltransferase substrate binding protein [Marinobacterium arenosum]